MTDLEEDGEAGHTVEPWYELPGQARVYVIRKVQRYARSLLLAMHLQAALQSVQALQSLSTCCTCNSPVGSLKPLHGKVYKL